MAVPLSSRDLVFPQSFRVHLKNVRAAIAASLREYISKMASASLHEHVSLHFLVQCGAEIRAIEREPARLVRREFDDLCFTRVGDDVDVVFIQTKPVKFVRRLLDVGQVDRHFVPFIYFYLPRIE